MFLIQLMHCCVFLSCTVVGRYVTWPLKFSCNDTICQLKRQLKDFNESYEGIVLSVRLHICHVACLPPAMLVSFPALKKKIVWGEGGIYFMNFKYIFCIDNVELLYCSFSAGKCILLKYLGTLPCSPVLTEYWFCQYWAENSLVSFMFIQAFNGLYLSAGV